MAVLIPAFVAVQVLLPRQLRFQHVYSRSEVFFRPFGKLCIGSGNYIFGRNGILSIVLQATNYLSI